MTDRAHESLGTWRTLWQTAHVQTSISSKHWENKHAKTCYSAEKKPLQINGKQTLNYRPISSCHRLYKIVFCLFSSVHETSPVIYLLTYIIQEFSQLYFTGETVFLIQHFSLEVDVNCTDGTKSAGDSVVHLLQHGYRAEAHVLFYAFSLLHRSLRCWLPALSVPELASDRSSRDISIQALLVVPVCSTLNDFVIGLGWFLSFWPRGRWVCTIKARDGIS